MLPVVGRPRKACGACKRRKIRCTGERPSCTRCVTLKHACIYNDPPGVRSHARGKRQQLPRSSYGESGLASLLATSPTTGILLGEQIPSDEPSRVGNRALSIPHPLPRSSYLGIPKPLMSELVDTYFSNVYNASLLLHKRTFLESLETGAAQAHVVLSVCAWGANFHRDAGGRAALKDHGFMVEWAQRASQLVFQEIDKFHDDNVVTFLNLALFWHSQGSWRTSLLHKGNAYQSLLIGGLGSKAVRSANGLEFEIKRRRFWACYLMHCHTADRSSSFEAIADVQNLALPWPEEDFEAGIASGPIATLSAAQGNKSVFAEVIKGLTLWSSVVSVIKSHHFRLTAKKVAEIQALDEEISAWWSQLGARFKLQPDAVATIPEDVLPKVLLITMAYYQSLCALHASIVPLFCWSPGDDSWARARQLSAQTAFDHACASSALIAAVLSWYPRLSAVPTFVSHAAYSSCAIQLPFLWCANVAVRDRVRANIKANIEMVDAMAAHWRFAELEGLYIGCLHSVHQKHPPLLEDEPKNVDIKKLTSLNYDIPSARVSILEFLGVLWTREDGCSRPGEETIDLGIKENTAMDGSGTHILTSSATAGK
ncbi:hypothetical protein GQ53DRAFT_884572 [Thozetella sp. PMI_491]|nr:hypothetical protein GQ53DRAFT_884572 [Thozetella sp. PMI_491]